MRDYLLYFSNNCYARRLPAVLAAVVAAAAPGLVESTPSSEQVLLSPQQEDLPTAQPTALSMLAEQVRHVLQSNSSQQDVVGSNLLSVEQQPEGLAAGACLSQLLSAELAGYDKDAVLAAVNRVCQEQNELAARAAREVGASREPLDDSPNGAAGKEPTKSGREIKNNDDRSDKRRFHVRVRMPKGGCVRARVRA